MINYKRKYLISEIVLGLLFTIVAIDGYRSDHPWWYVGILAGAAIMAANSAVQTYKDKTNGKSR